MSRDIEEKPRAADEGSKDKDLLSPDDKASSKRGRGLLHVPSRSSSQRIQPSPTSTGLSGATASDPRDSIDGHSKESKGSMLGRYRNGSASSNHSAVGTEPTNSPGNSHPNSPATATHKRKKKGGLLSLFNCCGVPAAAGGLEPSDDPPSHRVEKLPPRPATASRRTVTPSEQPLNSKTQLQEKDSPQRQRQQGQGTSENGTGKRASGASAQHQSAGGEKDPDSKQTGLDGSSAPVVTVDPPHAAASEEAPGSTEGGNGSTEKDLEGDVSMPDAESASREQQPQPVAEDDADDTFPDVPPPPPGPIPAVPTAPTSQLEEGMPIFAPDQPQKFLLPPQASEFKGKKCLVLDLDETLVHSSFKVS